MGQAATTPDVLSALLACFSASEEFVREAAARVVGQMGQAAATPDALSALLARLADSRWAVRYAAVEALKNLSTHVPPPDRTKAIELFLPLARREDREERDVGYVGLRNLLAAGPL
jgi:HEAT repeat protein